MLARGLAKAGLWAGLAGGSTTSAEKEEEEDCLKSSVQ